MERLEKIIIFNQLKENNYTHTWKLMYREVNDYIAITKAFQMRIG